MMVEPIIFPHRLACRAASKSWNLLGNVTGPGQSGIGTFPVARMDGGGVWTADLNGIVLREADDMAMFRAVRMLAQGGVQPMLVERLDMMLPPVPIVDGKKQYGMVEVPHSDDAPFSDGTLYSQSPIDAYTVGAAALRATTLTIEFLTGSPLRGGESFSIAHPTQRDHMYEIATVEVDTSGNSVVTFSPPLREAVTDGTYVEFYRPRCVMRLKTPDAMNIAMEVRPFPRPNVSFIEYFYPVT